MQNPSPLRALADRGYARWPRLLPPPLLVRLQASAMAAYADLARRLGDAVPALPIELAPGVRHVPTADSISLAALPDAAATWAAAEAALAPIFAVEFGGPPRRLSAHAWLRRQHPPGRPRPPGVPHGWHQDGGLGFDYLGGDVSTGLLPMLTAWIPLVDCGRDAPGLRLEPRRRSTLIPLTRLADGPSAFDVPALAAGEAVLMHGGTLHATASVGTASRISVELRWLPRGRPARV